jgi:LCP family protein required for cell wall assembly
MVRRLSRRYERLVVVFAILAVVGAVLNVYSRTGEPALVIGKLRNVEKIREGPAPTAEPAPPAPPVKPVSQVAPYLRKAPPPPPVAAALPILNIPKDLKFFLVIGSDARPGQDITRARADSIHIAAVDPLVKKGTVLGIPRDSYVDIPGHGKRKINAALALGGPDLLGQVVKNVTGLPVSHYAVTGFDGMTRITDELEGVDIDVPYEMKDKYSGADFEPGKRHMNGRDVLAFSRARHGVPGGDLGRSLNHGRVILQTLEKMRKEVSSGDGIMKWLKILYKHASLNMSIGDAFELGKLARQISPSNLENVVASGSSETINGQSVIVLNDEAKALFRDVGADAMADGDEKRDPPPPPKPKPTPQPTPTPLLDDVIGGVL